jgi:hypothetical protein
LWSGSEPWAGSTFSNASFVQQFLSGAGPNASTTSASVKWVDEP